MGAHERINGAQEQSMGACEQGNTQGTGTWAAWIKTIGNITKDE